MYILIRSSSNCDASNLGTTFLETQPMSSEVVSLPLSKIKVLKTGLEFRRYEHPLLKFYCIGTKIYCIGILK